MPDLAPFQIIGAIGAVIVVVGWLGATFAGSQEARERLAWVGALGLFVALLSLFVHLWLGAQAAGSRGGMVGFGFLGGLFAVSTVVCLWKTVRALSGRGAGSGDHATH